LPTAYYIIINIAVRIIIKIIINDEAPFWALGVLNEQVETSR
jgi:hypothetical protein